ncbi:Response regulator rcp1 [Rubripirellula tenax]|uniref:Response regulator rcp1 n=1 Tax=Rubripirellula tenax TaxID=2528015 RepID=A0A5C6EER8_9BACT|nr:response regulator [Rubripirellula tenax]TWU47512.1 Response regulator rcp1 [Rubripirellula tenax]
MVSLPPIVMVVEDDFVDVELVKRGIRARKLNYGLLTSSDGNQALEMLRSDKLTHEERERLIVFLDINMPGMNGHQFLTKLREDPNLRRTIVFVLTTSDHPRDKQMAYDNNVAGYFVKSNLEGLLDTVAVYVENVEFPPVLP